MSFASFCPLLMTKQIANAMINQKSERVAPWLPLATLFFGCRDTAIDHCGRRLIYEKRRRACWRRGSPAWSIERPIGHQTTPDALNQNHTFVSARITDFNCQQETAHQPVKTQRRLVTQEHWSGARVCCGSSGLTSETQRHCQLNRYLTTV